MDQIGPMTIDSLIVPLDGSRLAEVVIPAVAELARRLSARAVLLHVLEARPPSTVHGDRHLTSAGEADAYLREIAGRLAEKGVEVDYHSHDSPEGDLAASVAAHAGELKVSMLVLSTHGTGRPRDWIWGSIAQQVVRQVPVPILLIRPVGEEVPSFAPRAVVASLDGTPEGEQVLPAALAFTQAFGAVLHLVMVVPTLATISGDRAAAAMLVPSATAAALNLDAEAAATYVRDLAARLSSSGVAVETEVARGDVAQRVVEAAEREAPSLLAMTTHGRGMLDALWSASVGSRVMHRTQGPMLLVRASSGINE
jgi:nucleotide-binding universal stress UspA family protein